MKRAIEREYSDYLSELTDALGDHVFQLAQVLEAAKRFKAAHGRDAASTAILFAWAKKQNWEIPLEPSGDVFDQAYKQCLQRAKMLNSRETMN